MTISINPGQTIGIIGGGQLGQMMTLSAKEMNYKVIILDPSQDCPASTVADEMIVADYSNIEKIIELAKKSDVVTYEFENVNAETIKKIEDITYVPQGIKALEISQNRILEKNFLKENRLPVVNYSVVKSQQDLNRAIDEIGIPCILKTATGGYDGHGQVNVRDSADLLEATKLLNGEDTLVLEQMIDFQKEVSIIISRNDSGNTAISSVIENEHRENILHISYVPSSISQEKSEIIKTVAIEIANNMELVGTMGIEFFIGKDEKLYINEIAPRPHNSGHLTIEACDFSQFDLHIKSICNLAIKDPMLLKSAVMINVLGQHIELVKEKLKHFDNWHYHDYGKNEALHNRKMGHITVLTDDVLQTKLEFQKTNIWN